MPTRCNDIHGACHNTGYIMNLNCIHVLWANSIISNGFNAGDLNVPQCKKNRANLTLAV